MKFLVRKSPEGFIKSVNDEIGSLLNRHFDSYFPEAQFWDCEDDKYSMPIEVTDKEKSYELKAELPGVKKENLNVDIDSSCITIKAKKEEEKIDEEKNYKRSEFRYGEFSRTLYFPEEIDIDNSKAELKDGILKIEVPKKMLEGENRKKLEIK